MTTKISGTITVSFVRGGVNKTGKPYLQVSDGVEAKFINVKKVDVQPESFNYTRGDVLELDVEVDPFSGDISLLQLPE